MRAAEVKERGWTGHYIMGDRCRFRRNTLVTKGRRHIVVSTVGNMFHAREPEPDTIGHDRMYETLVFVGQTEGAYIEADVGRQISTSPMRWEISVAAYRANKDAIDNEANDMHDAMVAWAVRCFDRLYRKRGKKEGT